MDGVLVRGEEDSRMSSKKEGRESSMNLVLGHSMDAEEHGIMSSRAWQRS